MLCALRQAKDHEAPPRIPALLASVVVFKGSFYAVFHKIWSLFYRWEAVFLVPCRSRLTCATVCFSEQEQTLRHVFFSGGECPTGIGRRCVCVCVCDFFQWKRVEIKNNLRPGPSDDVRREPRWELACFQRVDRNRVIVIDFLTKYVFQSVMLDEKWMLWSILRTFASFQSN